MEPENQAKGESADLRRCAEKQVAQPTKIEAARKSGDPHRLIHELEVRQAELELQTEQLEANYDELYDFAPVGYFTLGCHGNIQKINLTGATMLGQARVRLLRRDFASFVSPESRPDFDEFLRRVMGGRRKESCMVTLIKGGKTAVAAYIEASSVGPDSSCRLVVVDITAANQARSALRDSEERLKLALAASSMGVWEWECDSTNLYWSPECFKIFGVESVCPTLDTVAQLLHPEDAPRVRSIVGQALAEGTEQSVECRIIRPDGEVVWIYARGHVQCDEAGAPLRMIGIAQDITERKRIEQNACPVPARRTACCAN